MASYGDGFARGMNAGTSAVNSAYDLFTKAEAKNARDNVPEALFAQQQQQDLSDYDQAQGQLFGGDYQPNEAEMRALRDGRESLEREKPSSLFFNQVTNMNTQERLGHMMQLFQSSGGKLNDASFQAINGVNGMFDQAQNQDLAQEQAETKMKLFEAQERQAEAKANLFNKQAEDPHAKESRTKLIKNFEYYQSKGGKLPFDEFATTIQRRDNNQMSPYQQEAIDLKKQQQEMKLKETRNKAIKYLEEELPHWDRLKGKQKEQAINKYLETGYLPTINKKDAEGWGIGADSYDYTVEDEVMENPEEEMNTTKKKKSVDDILNNL